MPLLERQSVYIVDGPLTVDGVEFWQVADSDWPGCCEVLGWIPATSDGEPTIGSIEPSRLRCPAPNLVLDSSQIETLGRMHALACFGSSELTLAGGLYCSEPIVDASYFLAGPPWVLDRVQCHLNDQMAVYGQPVTSIQRTGNWYLGGYRLEGHFDDPSSNLCTWVRGNFSPIDTDGAPVDAAVFACRTLFLVTGAESLQ